MVRPPKLCLISTLVMLTLELELDAADSALSFLVSFSCDLHVMCERWTAYRHSGLLMMAGFKSVSGIIVS